MWNGLPLYQGPQGYTQFHGIIGGTRWPSRDEKDAVYVQPELKYDLIKLDQDRRIGIATSSLGQVQYWPDYKTKKVNLIQKSSWNIPDQYWRK